MITCTFPVYIDEILQSANLFDKSSRTFFSPLVKSRVSVLPIIEIETRVFIKRDFTEARCPLGCPSIVKVCGSTWKSKSNNASFKSSYLMKYVQVNLCQKLFFLQNIGRTCCVQKLFWMSETISVHTMFSPGLSL